MPGRGWSLIRILGPRELREWQGWVPGPSLGRVLLNGSVRRIYRAADFDWLKGSKPEQAALLKVINRVADERPDFETIDTRSLVVTGSGAARRYSVGASGRMTRPPSTSPQPMQPAAGASPPSRRSARWLR